MEVTSRIEIESDSLFGSGLGREPGKGLARRFGRRRWRPFLSRPFLSRIARLLMIVVLTAGSGETLSAAQTPTEYQVKAAFIYNFAKFVEWPADTFGGAGSPLVLGILGDDPFGEVIDQTISGKTVNSRQLVIKRLKWGQNLRECHILFVSASERKRLPQVFESLKGTSALTVSECDKFTQQGGIINLIMEENKVRFDINMNAAEQARLKISSKLLALAKSIVGEHRAGRN